MSLSSRLTLATLTLALAGSTARAQDAPKPPPDWSGRDAPAFELPSLKDGPVSLQGLRKKVVVIHFAASW